MKHTEKKRVLKYEADINHNLSIIILNVNGLNTPSKRHKYDPNICCLQETVFRFKDTNTLQIRAWKKKICHANNNQRRATVATFLSDKMTLRQKLLERKRDIL